VKVTTHLGCLGGAMIVILIVVIYKEPRQVQIMPLSMAFLQMTHQYKLDIYGRILICSIGHWRKITGS
jgi:hypothetical protein